MIDTADTLLQFECDLCGGCCRTFPIFASLEDARREPRIVAESLELAPQLTTDQWHFKLYPLPFQECCSFLDGENKCEIYVSRPDVCRSFSAGSEQCQEARQRIGVPPLLPKAPN